MVASFARSLYLRSARAGTLYVVATPIGNLRDLSRRAADVLAHVPVIAAESVHTAENLVRASAQTEDHHSAQPDSSRKRPQPPPGLGRFPGTAPRVVSYHSHNEAERVPELIAALEAGDDVAIVSRAGTPGWRDPGQILVAAAHRHGFDVCSLPGPSSVASALAASGLSGDRLLFEGYLPLLKHLRLQRLGEIREFARGTADIMTVAVFGDGATLDDVLVDIGQVFGDGARTCIAKELTMHHEHVIAGPVKELSSTWMSLPSERRRGALVLLFEIPLDNLSAPAASKHPPVAPAGSIDSAGGVGSEQQQQHSVGRVVQLLLRGGVPPQKVALLCMQLTGSSMPIVRQAVQEAVLGDRTRADANAADANSGAGSPFGDRSGDGDAGRQGGHARRTLHLVNLGPHVTAEELTVALAIAGSPSGNVSVSDNHVGERIAFVRYSSVESATAARASINLAQVSLGAGRPVLAGWARRDRWIM